MPEHVIVPRTLSSVRVVMEWTRDRSSCYAGDTCLLKLPRKDTTCTDKDYNKLPREAAKGAQHHRGRTKSDDRSSTDGEMKRTVQYIMRLLSEK
jgi:hypothetical protein